MCALSVERSMLQAPSCAKGKRSKYARNSSICSLLFFLKGSLMGLLLQQRQLQAEIEVWSEQDKDRDGQETRIEAGRIQAKRRVSFCMCVCVCAWVGVSCFVLVA